VSLSAYRASESSVSFFKFGDLFLSQK